MKFIILIPFLLLFSAFQSSHIDDPGSTFQGGERLTYRVYYNWNFVWLTAGEVQFEIKDEGDVYHLDVTGKTYSSYEWFYKVRDKYHSYIDKKSGLPKLYIRDIHQGNYRHYEKIVFDYANRKAYSYAGKDMNNLTMSEMDLDKDYFDLISCMYFLRNTDMEQFRQTGRTSFNLILDNEKYELSVKLKDKLKNIDIKDDGNFKTMHAIADVVSGKVFSDEARLHIWIGEDQNRIPVMIESPLIVGSVKAVLAGYSNLKFPLESKVR